MLQVRKLVLAVAAVTAFTSSYAHALGLGDIAVKSSLNQPLEAEISLLEVRDLTSAEVKSRLASPEEFSKAGVDRQFFLTGLTFTPEISSSGKNVIRVSSKQPVKEPYLNFLVEVIWPNGRLLREYTLLLDPPLYAPQQVIYAPELAATPAAATIQPSSQARRQVPPRRAPAASTPQVAQGGEYRVQKNDTLWDIASRVKGSGSVHQAMLAIQDLNPNAFVNGNINRMKSGQVLRLPDAQAINRRTHNQAVAQVNQQNQNWKAGTSPALAERQLDATRRAEAGATPAAIEKKDSLRLVSDATGQSQQAADQGTDAEIRALQDKLARSEEFLDSTILEKEELQSRVEDLSSQLEKLQRLIELKDNQLAQLQNADELLAELPTEDTESTTEASVDTAALAESTELAEMDEAAVVAPEGLQLSAEAQAAAGGDGNAADDTAESMAATPEPVVESAGEELASPAEQPLAVTSEPAAADKTLLEKVLDNPTLLAATGGTAVLALLLLLLSLSRSRARKQAEQQAAESVDTPPFDAPAGAAAELDSVPPVADLTALQGMAPEQETDDDPLAGFDATEPVVETQIKAEETDPLAEAASYIGFGRLNQAADVLHKALEAEPERVDLRHKLLEVYADLEDQVNFSKQIEELSAMGGAEQQLAQLKGRYPEMFVTEQVLAPVLDEELADLDLELDLDESKLDDITETLADSSDLDAELDELSAFLDDAALAAEPEPPATASAELDALALDGLGELEELAGAELAEQENKETALDLDFDLDLDLSEPTTTTTAADEVSTEKPLDALDELDLDLESLDLDLAAMEQTESEATQTAADELSLDELSRDLEEAIQDAQPEGDLDDAFSFEAFETDTAKHDLAEFGLQLDDLNLEQDALTESPSAEALDDSLQLETALDSALQDSAGQLAADSPAETEPLADLTDLGDLESLDSIDDDFSFLSGTDETATKLDLARAYIDMGDAEGARDILDEVLAEGTAEQQDEARQLAKQLG